MVRRLFSFALIIFLLAGMMPVGALADTVDNWTVRSPLPTGQSLYGVAYGNGVYVSVGIGGTAMTSADGANWTIHASGIESNTMLFSVTYGNGLFVAVGWAGKIFTSPDGVNWTSRTSGSGEYLYNVTYGNGLFVASGSSDVITTSADGITWTVRSSGNFANSFQSALYANGMFVAVGMSGLLKTSSNGTSWTSRSSGTTNHFRSITYGSGNFVAVGDSGMIMTSSNGTSWTSRSSGTTTSLIGVTYGNGMYVAVGNNGVIVTSGNGTDWTSRTSGTTNYLLGVAFLNGMYVAVGLYGSVLTSADGINWTSHMSGTTVDLFGIAYGDGQYVAVGQSGEIVTSGDGLTWNPFTVNSSMQFQRVVYGSGQFVAIGYSGLIATSADGTNWTSRTSGTSAHLAGVAYGNGKYVAVGQSGAFTTSGNGVSWTGGTSGTSYLRGVAYGNNGNDGLFVAVGDAGTIKTSGDGSSWTNRTSGTGNNLYGVAYGNGRFVALETNGAIRTSGDGVNWTTGSTGIAQYLGAISYGNGLFMAVGDGGAIVSSADGVNWTRRTSNATQQLNGIVAGNGTNVAVGARGTIVQSAATAKPANNSVAASPVSVAAGAAVTLTASGDRQSAAAPANGDERYVPSGWTSTESDKSGTFSLNAGSYTAVYTPAAANENGYTVTVTFTKQVWNGNAWEDTSTTDTKTATVAVSVQPHAVTYDGNGQTAGTVPADGSVYRQGDSVTVLGNTGHLTRAGYTFAGWNTAADGSGNNYAADGTATLVMGADAVTLYAKWVKEDGTQAGAIAGISLDATKYTLAVGGMHTTIMRTNDADNSSAAIASGNVTFVSSNAAVATVDAGGVVTGIAKGTATIGASYTTGGKTYKRYATVAVDPKAPAFAEKGERKTGAVHISVVDPDNKPVPDAVVKISQGGKVWPLARTDGDGRLLAYVPAGTYNVLVYATNGSTLQNFAATKLKVPAGQRAEPLAPQRLVAGSVAFGVATASGTDKQLTGTAPAGATIVARDGEVTLGTAKANKSGQFKLKLKSPQPGKTLAVTAVDAYENEQTVDVEVPEVAAATPTGKR
ncbi:InlB B-repeat-containing protein [Paenibacillus cymbidii]|uniref:InlB B-repeat-containing protein n=1 Tax=Paenibacillus cymbidii TaxID=1639034 RepID=UPI00108169B5|nr:InlB B-repeat-containing protein [Paenibacillus cymbidii]